MNVCFCNFIPFFFLYEINEILKSAFLLSDIFGYFFFFDAIHSFALAPALVPKGFEETTLATSYPQPF